MPEFDLDAALAVQDVTEFTNRCPSDCDGTLLVNGFSSGATPEVHIWAICSNLHHDFKVTYQFVGQSIDRNPLPDTGRTQGQCPHCAVNPEIEHPTEYLGVTAESGENIEDSVLPNRVFSRCRCRDDWRHYWSDVYEFVRLEEEEHNDA